MNGGGTIHRSARGFLSDSTLLIAYSVAIELIWFVSRGVATSTALISQPNAAWKNFVPLWQNLVVIFDLVCQTNASKRYTKA
jgi:fumarate reductase subunit C